MKSKNNKIKPDNRRAYINTEGELVMNGLNPFPETPHKAPTQVSVARADNADTITLSMMLTGLSNEGYFMSMVSLALEWFTTVRGMTDHEAVAMMEQPDINAWWYHQFMDREKMLAGSLADYYEKRVNLQAAGKLAPNLKRIVAQSETCSYWLRMHRMILIEHTWQHRRLKDSYLNLAVNPKK